MRNMEETKMGGRSGGGGRGGRGGGGLGGGATGGAGGLTEMDRTSIQTTNSILAAGIKPNEANATEVSRTAADIINGATPTGYTVYGSTFNGMTTDSTGNLKSHTFAGVSVETKGAMNRGARILEDNGFKVTKVDNDLYKGLVVST